MHERARHSQPQRLAEQSTEILHSAESVADPIERDVRFREAQRLAGDSALADAYSYLQKAVGLIALSIPPVVAVGHLASGGEGLKGSISSYYHTHLGNYFVGSLCALGVFFLSYNYRPLRDFRLDNLLSNVAAAMAVGVALFPTARDAETASDGEKLVALLHLGFAGTLFALLAVFCLFMFTKTNRPGPIRPAKRRRNRVYRTCGWTIVVSMALVLLANAVDPPDRWHAVFWLETVMVFAFGFSWLVKGEFLGWFADR